MFPFQEKLSNFYIATQQNWTETLQEKERNYPLHVTAGYKAMKLWRMKVCQNSGQNHNAHA